MRKKEFEFQNPENALKLSFLLGNGQVVLITSCDAQKKVQGILTASWMTPTSHIPFLLTISIGNGNEGAEDDSYRSSYALIEETMEFGLNLPSRNLIEAVGKIGSMHSNQVDKYAETGLTAFESKIIKANLIKECYLNMECRVTDEYITGDHTVFVAEPAFVYLDENVLTDGKFSDKYRSKDNQIHFADIIEMWNMW
jgi:flavin reductase (DIM6/NTAB) family NADH-FMN oxidoreductase RutF